MIQARTAKAPEYYLTQDCPVEGQDIEARWGGKGSRLLALDDKFGTLSYLRLAKGLNPETGSKLTARLKSNRIEATDVCMTVPKSVSTLIEVMQDERVKTALWDANDYAMRLYEKKACVRVRKGGVYKDRQSGNMTWASFYHGTTRPIEEKSDPSHAAFYSNGVEILVSSANDNTPKPDPHSHIHNYVTNVSWDKVEGQWKALKRHRFDLARLEDKFHKRLADNLKAIGYEVEWNKTAFEVRGISEDVLDLFSRRHGEVKEEEDRKPYLNGKGNKTYNKKLEAAKAQLSQVTRKEKIVSPELTRESCHAFWLSRLTDLQYNGLAAVVHLSQKMTKRIRIKQRLQHGLDKLRQAVLDHSEEYSRGIER